MCLHTLVRVLRRQIGPVPFVLLAALLPATSGTGWAQPVPIGGEFQISTLTSGDQMFPNLGGVVGGDFVVVWQDYASARLLGRIVDDAGMLQGAEFEASAQGYDPAVAVGAAGGFVVTWERHDNIYGQRHDSAGTLVGGEFQINSYTSSVRSLSDVAANADGDFVVVWESNLQDGNGRGVFGQHYDGAGVPMGGEFQINSYTTGNQSVPVVGAASSGDLTVVWSTAQAGGSAWIAARRYDSAGAPVGDEFQVNTNPTDPFDPGVSVSPTGDVVIVWTGDDGDGRGIFGQRYDSSGAPIGNEFQVNSYTTGDQTISHATFGLPRARPVAHDDAGRFMVVWRSDDQDGSLSGVFGRRYTTAGAPDGREVQINTYTTGHQHAAHVASTTAGEFLVVWENDPQNGSPIGIVGRRLAIGGGAPMGARRLAIRNPASGPTRNGLAYLSRDASLAAPAGPSEDPRCVPLGSGDVSAGARLLLAGPGGVVEIELPCTNWSANADRTVYRYRDATGATCRRVVIRDGRVLQAVCKGPQVTYALGAPQDAVEFMLITGSAPGARKYCALLAAATAANVLRDGSNGRTYRAVDAAAPAICP